MKNQYVYLILFAFLISVAKDGYSQGKMEKRLALEVPFSVTKSLILIEAQLDKYVDVKEELSTDFGLGLRFAASDKVSFRFGYHFWKLPLNPSYEATAIDEFNNEVTISVIEDSDLKNSSVYLHVTYEGRYGFFGGGVNIGVTKNYQTRLSYYDEIGNLLLTESGSESLITDEFEKQSHVEIIGGFKIRASSILGIKPFMKISIPLQRIYDSHTASNTAYDMYALIMNFGIIVDVGLL